MRRAQELPAARDIIFTDSTASCDTTKCTVTVVLVATKAGAVPIAVLLHNEQSTDGYLMAFGLLKDKFPACFGGLPAPQVFMTDNSAAEKAALQQTWPTVRQLLCHFHVAQAEWRWLTASRNNIEKTQRRQLMSAFQQVMYADTEEKLEAARAQLLSQPHSAYVARAEAFLQRQEEWVLLFRSSVTTRGHNTNNFAEATIRVLKDIVLSRAEAFNVVALAGAADSIKVLDGGLYAVPSATNSATYYEVSADVGACACPAGIQGAFCKHQALVHGKFGGLFPNAPALTTNDRYLLGQLALGDKCPPESFFTPFLEAEATRDTQDDREAVYKSLETSLRRLHAMNEHNPAYLDILKGLTGGGTHPQWQRCNWCHACHKSNRCSPKAWTVHQSPTNEPSPTATRPHERVKRVPAGTTTRRTFHEEAKEEAPTLYKQM
ncbi:hypothetical protein MTO96_040086, partial [Rhipicephalus appendiculatus]